MLQKDNKIYLNLEEQVLKNKEDIENISSVNGLLGIKVVNQVESEGDLPAEASAEFDALEYGDAYVVVNEDDTYTFFIKTRPTTEKSYDHWFRLHLEGIQGPVGPKGEKGDKGEKGAIGVLAVDTNDVGTLNPTDYAVDESVMTTDGNVYRRNGNSWKYITNIRGIQGIQGPRGEQGNIGPQGVQGIQGEKGDPGAFISIKGRVSAVSQLPTPPERNTDAYFVGTATPTANNPIYIWSLDDGWINVGVLNVATYVTSGGVFVGQWDADSKVSVRTGSDLEVYSHYGTSQNGIKVASTATGNTLAQRTNGGQLRVGTAENASDAVPLSQAQSLVAGAVYVIDYNTFTAAQYTEALQAKNAKKEVQIISYSTFCDSISFDTAGEIHAHQTIGSNKYNIVLKNDGSKTRARESIYNVHTETGSAANNEINYTTANGVSIMGNSLRIFGPNVNVDLKPHPDSTTANNVFLPAEGGILVTSNTLNSVTSNLMNAIYDNKVKYEDTIVSNSSQRFPLDYHSLAVVTASNAQASDAVAIYNGSGTQLTNPTRVALIVHTANNTPSLIMVYRGGYNFEVITHIGAIQVGMATTATTIDVQQYKLNI